MNVSNYFAKQNDAKFMAMVFAAGALATFSCGATQSRSTGNTHIASSLRMSSDSYAVKRVDEPDMRQRIGNFAVNLAGAQQSLPAELAAAMAENWFSLFG